MKYANEWVLGLSGALFALGTIFLICDGILTFLAKLNGGVMRQDVSVECLLKLWDELSDLNRKVLIEVAEEIIARSELRQSSEVELDLQVSFSPRG